MLRRVFRSVIVVCLGVAGCVSQKVDSGHQPNEITVVRDNRNRPPNSGSTANYFDIDSCADRLHAIEGQLIGYYHNYHRLPLLVDELRPFAFPGDDMSYTCPVSHQPYIYVPNGMVLENTNQRFIMFDATPAHVGPKNEPIRWGIKVTPPADKKPLTFDVVYIPESWMSHLKQAPPISNPVTTQPAQ